MLKPVFGGPFPPATGIPFSVDSGPFRVSLDIGSAGYLLLPHRANAEVGSIGSGPSALTNELLWVKQTK
jgi:hypothetical protein